jgi:hypothetical protein
VPEIREVPLAEIEERHLVAMLGTLPHNVSSRYILDLSLPQRTDGKYVVAQLELTYDLGTGQQASSGPIPLEICYTSAGQGYVNAEVMKHIDDIQLKDLSDNLHQALQNNDSRTALQVAQEMKEKAELMGTRARKKTILAQQVLQELNAERRVSKKTQVALDNEARIVESP